jgi:hypothetical protein
MVSFLILQAVFKNVNLRDEEVTIIVVSTGWLLADVLSPDTLHVTDSTRHPTTTQMNGGNNITVRVSLVTT